MAYNPTKFNEGAAPGLSASELNKIGGGIRANALGLSTDEPTLTYDDVGNLTKVEDYEGDNVVKTTNLTYDATGKLTTVEEVTNDLTIVTTLHYDNDDNLTNTTKAVE